MSDVGDLVKVILASVIFYCFDFTVGSHFVSLIWVFPYVISLCHSHDSATHMNQVKIKQMSGLPMSAVILSVEIKRSTAAYVVPSLIRKLIFSLPSDVTSKSPHLT